MLPGGEDPVATRQAHIFREAVTDARRLMAADQALAKGEVRLAAMAAKGQILSLPWIII